MFPPDCKDCESRQCKCPATITLRSGIEVGPHSCPKQILEDDPAEQRAIWEAVRAWRHWSKGNLESAFPDASEALTTLVLWVDDAVSEHHIEQMERENERHA